MQAKIADSDPTWLTDIDLRHEVFTEKLLGNLDPAVACCLEPSTLKAFRDLHVDRTFSCRYQSCPTSLNKFPSQDLRDKHEISHVKRFRCKEENCFMRNRGFRNNRELTLHLQQYHPPPKFPALNLKPELSPALLSARGGAGDVHPFTGSNEINMNFTMDDDDVLANFDFDTFLRNDDNESGFAIDPLNFAESLDNGME